MQVSGSEMLTSGGEERTLERALTEGICSLKGRWTTVRTVQREVWQQ